MGVKNEAQTEVVKVAQEDLLSGWAALERLVVSLHKIGSHFATSTANTPLSAESNLRMLEELEGFPSPELMKELSHARRTLSAYLPAERTEHYSENVIRYWCPNPTASNK